MEEQNKFEFCNTSFDDFISDGVKIKYSYQGELKNNTPNIYKKAIVRTQLFFTLQNQNILTCDEIDYTKEFLGSLDFKLRSNWKPEEKWQLKELESCSFSIEYADYPITKVRIQYYIELWDQINESHSNFLLLEKDVTDKWENLLRNLKEEEAVAHAYYDKDMRNKTKSFEHKKTFIVSSQRAYFYDKPNLETKRKGYLIQGQQVFYSKKEGGFISCTYINESGVTTSGWMIMSDFEHVIE